MEAAAKLIVDSITFSQVYDVNPAETDEEKTVSGIFIEASETDDELPLGSGNFITRLRLTLKNNPEDITDANHKADCTLLFERFRSDTIGADLSAKPVGEFYVYDPPRRCGFSKEENDDVHSDTIELDLLACESDL